MKNKDKYGYCQIMKWHLDRLTDAEYEAILKGNQILQNFVKAVNYERPGNGHGETGR